MNLHDDSPAKATLDFDPAESGYDAWSEKFATARKECPVFWSEAHGGYWTVANHESATRVARDWQTFSSQKSWDPATGHHEGGNVIPPPSFQWKPIRLSGSAIACCSIRFLRRRQRKDSARSRRK
jgi:hypothetical protein